MYIKSIGIFANPNNEGALDAVDSICTAAKYRNFNCYIDATLKKISEFSGMATTKDHIPDLMVAVGGDGTILRAADLASTNDIPVLGINFGRIGFLSEIDVDGFCRALDDIAADRFYTDKCMMLECRVNNGQALRCLNEAVLYRKYFSGVITIRVFINDVDAGEVSGDGLIISTPTGATGYSISAGGPVIASGMDVDIITPICPHTFSFRPIIAPPDSNIRLSAKQEGFLALDGISTKHIFPGDIIEIARSSSHARFIRFSERNIFALISSKLS